MKVVILGDVHLMAGLNFGKIDSDTGINSRLLDYEKTLGDIVSYAIDNKIELFVFLGDIFEVRTPNSQAMVIFLRQLNRLSSAGITTYVISGNHDESKSRKIFSSLDIIKESNIPNTYTFNDIEMMPFKDSRGEAINILLMPYRNRHNYDVETNEEAIVEIVNELKLAKQKTIPDAPILLAGHMMMEGTIPTDAGDYSTNELILSFDMFDGIDTVINGHIHRSSIIKQEPLFIYSGSMECKDFSEREHKKVFIVYDSLRKGMEAITFVPIKTRKFIDFEIDFSAKCPENIMEAVVSEIAAVDLTDAVVRALIKVPDAKIALVDIEAIRSLLHSKNVNCIANINAQPVVSRQLRNQKVNEAIDDVSAFKHYVSSQTNIEPDVLEVGLAIIRSEQNSEVDKWSLLD